MSIKLSLKELKDLLKIQNKKIKKRRRNKKKALKAYGNNIRSSSDHMISSGMTLSNTANEQTELVRLQRQALEEKLKEDKVKREEEAQAQNESDKTGALTVRGRGPLTGRGGNNNMRADDPNMQNIHNSINYIFGELGKTVVMPKHGEGGDPRVQRNVQFEEYESDPTSIWDDEKDKNAQYEGDVTILEEEKKDSPKKDETPSKVKGGVKSMMTSIFGGGKKTAGVAGGGGTEQTDIEMEDVSKKPKQRKSRRIAIVNEEVAEDPKTIKLNKLNKPALIQYLNNNKYKGKLGVNASLSKSDIFADAEYYQSQLNDPNFTF